jgi:hypothetical protein
MSVGGVTICDFAGPCAFPEFEGLIPLPDLWEPPHEFLGGMIQSATLDIAECSRAVSCQTVRGRILLGMLKI